MARSLEQLKDKKLIKKGAKNTATGHVHYHVSKAGEKHLGPGATAPSPAPAAPAPAPPPAAATQPAAGTMPTTSP